MGTKRNKSCIVEKYKCILALDFSTATLNAKISWCNSYKVLRKIKTWAKILQITKLSFKYNITGQNNTGWQIFSGMQKLREYSIYGPFWREKNKANLINNSSQLSDEAKQNKIWNGKPVIKDWLRTLNPFKNRINTKHLWKWRL